MEICRDIENICNEKGTLGQLAPGFFNAFKNVIQGFLRRLWDFFGNFGIEIKVPLKFWKGYGGLFKGFGRAF